MINPCLNVCYFLNNFKQSKAYFTVLSNSPCFDIGWKSRCLLQIIPSGVRVYYISSVQNATQSKRQNPRKRNGQRCKNPLRTKRIWNYFLSKTRTKTTWSSFQSRGDKISAYQKAERNHFRPNGGWMQCHKADLLQIALKFAAYEKKQKFFWNMF